MLMDLFFQSLPLRRKRRVHFDDFMLHVHQRIHHFKTLDATGGAPDAENVNNSSGINGHKDLLKCESCCCIFGTKVTPQIEENVC